MSGFISLYPSLVSKNVHSYKGFPSIFKPLAQTIEFLLSRIQALCFRILNSFYYQSNFLTDEKIARHMTNHLKPLTFSSCSLSQLQSIQKTCLILAQRGLRTKASLEKLDHQIDQHSAAIKIQNRIKDYLTRKNGRQSEAATKIQAIYRGYCERKKFQKKLNLTIKIQSFCRSNLAKAEKERLEKEKIPACIAFDQFKKSTTPIEDGYGEYIIFDRSSNPVSQKVYNLAYKKMYQFVLNPNVSGQPSKLIHAAIQRIDPNLDVVFLPRTLYELIYIHAAIKEEMEENLAICELQDDLKYRRIFKEPLERDASPNSYIDKKLKNCWHICVSTDENPVSNLDENVRRLAFRMNQLVVEKLQPKGSLTGQQITFYAERELDFLKQHYRTFSKEFLSPKSKIKRYDGSKGASINFGHDLSVGGGYVTSYPMCISSNLDAQIALNAVALEGSTAAQNAFILYRGGNPTKDAQLSEEKIKKTSLCYGTSLFAGTFRDGSATVFFYTITRRRDTYAIIVPYQEFANSPFYIPLSNAICQISSTGEFFHGRSMLVEENKGADLRAFSGISAMASVDIPDFLFTSKKVKKLTDQLNFYHSKAVLLTPKNWDTLKANQFKDTNK